MHWRESFQSAVRASRGRCCGIWLSGLIAKRYGETFPYGTLIVNFVGCFVIGFLFYLLYDRALAGPTPRIAIFIGLIGGFTTFSSYGLQIFTSKVTIVISCMN